MPIFNKQFGYQKLAFYNLVRSFIGGLKYTEILIGFPLMNLTAIDFPFNGLCF